MLAASARRHTRRADRVEVATPSGPNGNRDGRRPRRPGQLADSARNEPLTRRALAMPTTRHAKYGFDGRSTGARTASAPKPPPVAAARSPGVPQEALGVEVSRTSSPSVRPSPTRPPRSLRLASTQSRSRVDEESEKS